ncbi:hypothetical protein FRC15_009931 [Serendipita sp. 397]|nr:hypothetical protein FRC15_009931 [Serendipita sp. 397]
MEEISTGEMVAIDAQIAALIQKREETNERHIRCRTEMDALRDSVLSPLEERVERLKRLNRLQRSLTAPVTKLPVELLGDIFSCCVEMDETPWLLVLVSSVWRKIAFSMPKLWRYIWVTSGPPLGKQREWDVGGDIGRVTSVGQHTKCVTEAELIQVLALSGAVSLHVYLTLGSHVARREQSVDKDLLSQLFGSPTSERIEEISFLLSGSDDFLPTPLSLYFETSYPRLQSLTLSSDVSLWDMTFIRKILSSNELSSLKLYSGIPWERAPSIRWASVRHLTLPLKGLTPNTLNTFCDRIRNIQTLKIVPTGWPNASTPRMTFKLLEELDVRCETTHLRRLNLPSLTKLNLICLSDHVPDVHQPWSLPVLSEFKASLRSRAVAHFLPSMTMPQLTTLTLSISGYPFEPLSAVTYPSVTSVILESSAPSSYFIGLLDAVPNAEKVVLLMTESSKSNLREMVTRLMNNTNILCPKLSEIHFGTEEKPFFIPMRPFPSLLNRCVDRREFASKRPFKIVITTSSRRNNNISTEIYS